MCNAHAMLTQCSHLLSKHFLLGHLPTCFCFTSEAGSHGAQAGFNSCLCFLSTGISHASIGKELGTHARKENDWDLPKNPQEEAEMEYKLVMLTKVCSCHPKMFPEGLGKWHP